MAAALKIMANATISPALPALEASFPDVPTAAYLTRFLVSAPSLSVVLAAPLAGVAADRFGRVPLLVAGVVLFVLAGTAGAYLPDLPSILASRFILGVAVAMTMTAQVALVGDMFEGIRRSAFMGWQTAVINLSGFVFIGLAGYLAGYSPRLPFLVYGLPLLLLPLLASMAGRERASRKVVLTRGGDTGGDLPPEAGWLIRALAVGLLTLATVMLFFLMPSQLPYYLHENGFDSASATAAGLGTLTLSGGLFAFSFKRISDRSGLGMTLAFGYLVMGSGFATLALGATWGFLLTGTALVGAGYALVQPGFLLLALQVAPANRRGLVSGIVTTSMFLGQVVSPLLLTPVIQVVGFAPVFYGAAAMLCILALAALFSVRLLLQMRTTE
ncbi:MFS transporter [Rhodobacterales bacterium]|nr:MFS transporter [Rhodobacterales bacterium]